MRPIVIITGASSGLGWEIATQAAEKGYQPVLLARRKDKLESLAEEIQKRYAVDCPIYSLDMTDREAVGETAADLLITYPPDILVNCAGFGLFEEFAAIPFATIEKMFATNVQGLMQLTQLLLPAMQERKSGHIINIASQAGKIATPKSAVYSATKYAVLGFSNALRMELAPENIYVTTVNPGPIATNFFDIADSSGNYLKSVGFLVLDPKKVAHKIVSIFGKKKREINLPFAMNIGTRIYQIMPSLIEVLGKRAFMKK